MTMAAWGSAIAAVVAAATTAYSAYASAENAQEQADYQKKVNDNNNLIIERQQIDNANVAAQEAADKRQQTLRMMATQNAAGAGSGVQIGIGSMGKIQDETSQTGALDMLRILNNAQRGNQSLKTEQMNNLSNSKLAQMQADNIGQQSILTMAGAVAGLASNLTKNYDYKNFNSAGGWKIGFRGEK